jgi:hypothetical protein
MMSRITQISLICLSNAYLIVIHKTGIMLLILHHDKEYKALLNVERYLSLDLAYKYKRFISNFCCSCHILMVEKEKTVL